MYTNYPLSAPAEGARRAGASAAASHDFHRSRYQIDKWGAFESGGRSIMKLARKNGQSAWQGRARAADGRRPPARDLCAHNAPAPRRPTVQTAIQPINRKVSMLAFKQLSDPEILFSSLMLNAAVLQRKKPR
ncbi:hypothetical protein EVAR_103781_1 [Eumeta japonica]|uniref:Uncharacterized protein n=1 Tax=Eumeta variegata TaxID=151549 RepID=A0A4C1Z458_EUMVA|nr:hypothetical protein EVAR_103781_1 [Eumeta japonica]